MGSSGKVKTYAPCLYKGAQADYLCSELIERDLVRWYLQHPTLQRSNGLYVDSLPCAGKISFSRDFGFFGWVSAISNGLLQLTCTHDIARNDGQPSHRCPQPQSTRRPFQSAVPCHTHCRLEAPISVTSRKSGDQPSVHLADGPLRLSQMRS